MILRLCVTGRDAYNVFSDPAVPGRHGKSSTFRLSGVWLGLVEHSVRDRGVGGSNPLAPTKFQPVACNKLANERSGGPSPGRLFFFLTAAAFTEAESGSPRRNPRRESSVACEARCWRMQNMRLSAPSCSMTVAAFRNFAASQDTLRRRWLITITLLRAVGHVLAKGIVVRAMH